MVGTIFFSLHDEETSKKHPPKVRGSVIKYIYAQQIITTKGQYETWIRPKRRTSKLDIKWKKQEYKP